MKHNESGPKTKVHNTKEIEVISYQQFNNAPKISKTKRGNHTQEDQMAGNNQTES